MTAVPALSRKIIDYDVAEYYYNTRGIKDGIITYKQDDYPKDIGVYVLSAEIFFPKGLPMAV